MDSQQLTLTLETKHCYKWKIEQFHNEVFCETLFFEMPCGDEQLSVTFHCLLRRSETGFSWLMLAFAAYELFSTIVIQLAFVQV